MSTPTYNLQRLLELCGDNVRDITNPTQNNLKKVRNVNTILDELSVLADWSFGRRKKLFQYIYDDDYNGYGIENVLNISDYKEPDDIRKVDSHSEEFEYVKPDYLTARVGAGASKPYAYTVEQLDGKNALRLIYDTSATNTLIDSCDLYTTGGTWSGTATNIATDATIYKKGSGSVKFDIGTSSYLEETLTTAVDLTEFLTKSSWRLFVYLPSGSAVTNIELRFGSDSSNYYYVSATTQYDGTDFVNGWNKLNFRWSESISSTGTPDYDSVDYLRLTFTASSAQTGLRIDDLRIIEGVDMDFYYFSDMFVKVGTTWQNRFSEDTILQTEALIAPNSFIKALVSGVSFKTMAQLKGADNNEAISLQNEYERDKKQAVIRYSNPKKRPAPKVKIPSYW